jgi:benzoate membrane transport protein
LGRPGGKLPSLRRGARVVSENAAMRFFKDLSLSAFTAGFVAVLVGFTSSVAIVFQAAQAFGATPEQIASWMWALGIGMGLCTLVPSLWLKKPVMVAWSTPGAAVLASAGLAGGFSMAQAVGAFMLCAVFIALAGASGWFERVMNRIPVAIASALLAGVLARFGLQGFSAAQSAMPLVTVMVLAYLVGKRFVPRYAVPLTLLVAIIFVAIGAGFTATNIEFGITKPVWVTPEFSFSALVSLALPLFVVTMASQNLPGVAAIRAAGYADRRAQGGDAGIPISKVITLTGLATLVLAPFGAFALNLSAITAAICMGAEAHPDPARRYTAAATCGAMYVVIGIFGAAITGVLTAFPVELVAAIAGLALLGTIGGAMTAALQDESTREAAIMTFLVTLSGVVIAGVGSAFWGVVVGAVALLVQHYGRSKPAAD